MVESQLEVPLILVHLALATALFGLLLVLALLSNLRELPPSVGDVGPERNR